MIIFGNLKFSLKAISFVLVILVALFTTVTNVLAATTVTAATGGSSISSTTAGGTYTSLTGPVITEGAVGDVTTGAGSTGTIILNAPSGFEFDTGGTAPTVKIDRVSGNGADSRNINSVTDGTSVAITSISTSQITFTITSSGNNGVKNSLTWQNVRVRPQSGQTTASGNITESGTAGVNGVTGSTNLGTLTEIVVDTTPPTLTSVTIVSNNSDTTQAKVGNNVTLTFTASEAINTPSVAFKSGGASVTNSPTYTNTSGNTWTATYTTSSSDTEGTVTFSISFSDIAGNNGTAVTVVTDSSSVNFDKTAPTNQNTVFVSSVTKQGGASVTIVSSGSSSNSVWFAPSGTTSFSAGSTMTTAGGTATSISAPSAEGSYKMFVIDAAGNISSASTATLTVDNTAPTAAITYSISHAVKSGDSLTITATFSEAMADSPVVKVAITGANTVAATNMTKSSSTVYTYTDSVGSGDGTATVALSVGTDVAGNVVTSAPTSGATFTVDNTAPTISSLANTPASTSVVITWTTSETASSIVNYGLTNSLGSSTSEADTSPRVTSHSVTVSGLSTCTMYYYQAASNDAAGNQGTSSIDSFNTTGCVGNSPPNSPSSLGLTAYVNGSFGNTNNPTLNFSLSDSNGSDTVKYEILIDTHSNFSSPVVDYTSALAAQGARSFTVGQAVGGGSYTTGSSGQTLSDGSYYWKVKAVDNSGSSSGYTTANSGSIAFKVDTTAPTTPGTPSTSTPTNNTTPTWTWTASTDSGSGLATNAYTVQWCSDSSFTGCSSNTVTATTNSYTQGSVLSAGTWYFRAKATDSLGNVSSFSANGSVVIDTAAPVFSSIAENSASTSVTITWTTDEASSSEIDYGYVPSFGFSTSTTDTLPRVTSHSVNIAGLKSCARIFYRLNSIDAAGNQATSSRQHFNTTGCLTSSVKGGNEGSVDKSTGGSVSLNDGTNNASITVPANFSSDSASFQLNTLDTSTSATPPTNNSLIGPNLYDLVAVDSSGTQITNFTGSVTFTINYGDVSGSYNENTLDVYKYNGSSWDEKNCTLDTSAHTLTCSLPSFSVYGVFGQAVSSSSGSSSSSSSTSSGSASCADLAPTSAPNLFHIDPAGTYANLYFVKAGGSVSGYNINYGLDQDARQYGDSIDYSGLQWVIGRTVSHLLPNTTYYFRIQAKNGCNAGGWSKIVKIKTRNSWTDITQWFANLNPFKSLPEPPQTRAISYTPPVSKPTSCSYTIQKGDSLWSIAEHQWNNGSRYKDLLPLNPGINKANLKVGKVLTVCH